MANGESSENRIFYRSSGTINDIYFKLGEALDYSCSVDQVGSEVVISTPAGDYFISAEHAEQKYAELLELDRADTLKHQADGNISGAYLADRYAKDREGGGRSVRYGVYLDFLRFSPSAQWYSNYRSIEAEASRGDVVLNYFQHELVTSHDDMWMITTAATDAGISPDLFKLSSDMCNSQNNCSVKKYIKEGIQFASEEDPGTHHLTIYWGLAEPVNADIVRYNIFHEFLHKIYSKVARHSGLPRFAQHVTNVAKLSGNAERMKAADDYFKFYLEHCERPMIASGRTDRRAQSLFKAITYNVEEAVEPSLIRIIAPQFLVQASAYPRKICDEAKMLTVDDFANRLLKGDMVLEKVVHEASRIFKASRHGLDVSEWEQKVRMALETNREASELFDFMMVIFAAADDLVKSDQFKAQYIDTAELPMSLDLE